MCVVVVSVVAMNDICCITVVIIDRVVVAASVARVYLVDTFVLVVTVVHLLY